MQTIGSKRDQFVKIWITLSDTKGRESYKKKFLSQWAPAIGNIDVFVYLLSDQV